MEAPLTGARCTISNPHGNAVVDLNGDCLADIFLVCDDGGDRKSFQIWVNNKDDGFSLSQQGPLPSGTQSISLADVGMCPVSVIHTNAHPSRQGRHN